MQVEHDDKLAGPAVTDFCLGSSTSKSPPSTLPLSRQSTLPSSSAGSARPPSLASPHRPLSIVVPRTPGMDVVVDGASGLEDEDDVEYEAEPAPLPTEQDVSRLEEKLRELNVEYGLEDEEGDDEHREMVGLREIYGLVNFILPPFPFSSSCLRTDMLLIVPFGSLDCTSGSWIQDGRRYQASPGHARRRDRLPAPCHRRPRRAQPQGVSRAKVRRIVFCA